MKPNLHVRSFVKELDFTPEEWQGLLAAYAGAPVWNGLSDRLR